MPPAEQMPSPEGDMGMPPEAMPPDAGMPQEDQVMLTIPKAQFDQVNQMLNSFTELFNELASNVNQQYDAAMQEMAPEGMPPSEGGPEMDAFMQSIAEEGNVRK